MALIASLVSIAMYVLVSLATCRKSFDMDALLHREPRAAESTGRTLRRFDRLIGITDECTFGDRLIYYLKVSWTGFWILTFVIGTVWGLFAHIPDSVWFKWWLFTVVVGAVVCGLSVTFIHNGAMSSRSRRSSVLPGCPK